MQLYAKRGLQAGVKAAADAISPFPDDPTGMRAQVEGMRYEASDRRDDRPAAGAILARESAVQGRSDRKIQLEDQTGGVHAMAIDQDVSSSSGAVPNRGAGVSSYSETVSEIRP